MGQAAEDKAAEETLRDDLKKRYDQLNALWRKAESDLRGFHVPQPVGLLVSAEHREYFGWQRSKGEWRICFGEGKPGSDDFDGVSWKPIGECVLGVRLDMIAYFEPLKHQVVEACRKSVAELDKTIAIFEAALK